MDNFTATLALGLVARTGNRIRGEGKMFIASMLTGLLTFICYKLWVFRVKLMK